MARETLPFISGHTELRKRPALSEEINMGDFPIWLKLIIWGTMGLTLLYTLWGIFHSFVQS